MTLLQLKYVSTVAKYHSFRKAADELFISQPAISKMIGSLEEELGISIFIRSSGGVVLTKEGKELCDMAERLLSDADRIKMHFDNEHTLIAESMSVSSEHFCFVVDALSELQNSLTVDTDSYTFKHILGQLTAVIENVSDNVSELGVLYVSDYNKKLVEKLLSEHGLKFVPLYSQKAMIYIHNSHPLAKSKEISLSDLSPYPYIMYELDPDSPSILQEEIFLDDFYPARINVINGLYQALNLMLFSKAYDLGVGLVSHSNKGFGIICKPVKELTESYTIGYIYKENAHLSNNALKLIDIFKKYAHDFAPPL